MTQEVTAALAEIGRQNGRGEALVRLAGLRYGEDPAPSWLMQMNQAGFSSTARQTYYDLVHALHLRLLQALTRRAEARNQLTTRRAGQTQSVLKVASKLRRVS